MNATQKAKKTKTKTMSQQEKSDAVIKLLDSWCDVLDAEKQEQKETWEYLKKALDEDREAVSTRKLFS